MVVSGTSDGLSSYPPTPSTDAPPVSLTGEAPSSSRKSSGNSQPEINTLVCVNYACIYTPVKPKYIALVSTIESGWCSGSHFWGGDLIVSLYGWFSNCGSLLGSRISAVLSRRWQPHRPMESSHQHGQFSHGEFALLPNWLLVYHVWCFTLLQSRASLEDALSVMANQFDDPPTIGVGGPIQVPPEEDIAECIPPHSLLTEDDQLEIKPNRKYGLFFCASCCALESTMCPCCACVCSFSVKRS